MSLPMNITRTKVISAVKAAQWPSYLEAFACLGNESAQIQVSSLIRDSLKTYADALPLVSDINTIVLKNQ